MKRVRGGEGVSLIECINPRYNKYRVRWDVKPSSDEGNPQGVTFLEAEFLHKPTIQEIKDIILAWMNSEIDEQILSGFEWNGMKVWLSSENQFNYKAAYDLAVQTNGANLPVVFKFGTTENPTYYTFTSIEELQGFYVSAMNYINLVLNEGWARKDAMDWSEYEKSLNKQIQ